MVSQTRVPSSFNGDEEKKMRKPIFDIIRAQRGKGFTAEEVGAIDALLDRLGIEKEDAAPPPTVPDSVVTSVGTAGLDDPQAFFDSVRESGVLGGTLKPDQVKGLEAVLGAAKAASWPLAFTAYALATAGHETAHTMQPVREAFWLSENWRRANLRYYPFYGRGYVQLTWKANYQKADRELDLGGSLNSNLDLAMDPDIAAKIMVKGMQEGWFTGDKSGRRHTLVRHLPADGAASAAQFISARRIINGTDKASKIAGEAIKFQAALRAGGW
jgi:putative chitinase